MLRPVTGEELPRFRQLISNAFGADPAPSEGWHERLTSRLPLDRTRSIFSDGDMVSTSGAFPFQLDVPGGSVPCAGVTMVSVMPTHRRRGYLTAMMDALHEDAREREEPVAALWASESNIYGRFGYGAASDELSVKIPGGAVTIPDSVDSDSVSLIPEEEVVDVVARLQPDDRPGWFHRDEVWLRDSTLHDPPERRHGATAMRTGITGTIAQPTGYIRYRTKPSPGGNQPGVAVEVVELWGSSPSSWAGLWRFVLNIDLTTEVRASIRPTDDPLLMQATAPRRVQVDLVDNLWVAILDVGATLARRRYRAPFAATLEVTKGDRSERWRLEVDEDGSQCEPTTRSPDMVIPDQRLAESYLGRPRFGAGVRAGVIAADPELAAAADRAFSWSIPPFCPEIF